MKPTLSIRILFSYAVLGLLSLLVLCTFTQYSVNEYTKHHEAQQLYRKSSQIAADYASSYINYSLTLEDFQAQMDMLGKYLEASIWIVDNQGHILFDSSNPLTGQQAADSEYATVPDFNPTDFGNRYYMTGNFYGTFTSQTLTVFSPITSGYRVRSYVLIHKPLSVITKTADDFMNIAFFTVFIVYLCVLLLLLLFSLSIYLPVHKIMGAARSYANGDFKARTNLHQDDELGFLAGTLDYMADELATLEDDQRKFISNVSHDFRSPLTSIKGYVEAMLDGTIPPEMQEKYFNIILFETERLTKLTGNLLELNQLDHGSLVL